MMKHAPVLIGLALAVVAGAAAAEPALRQNVVVDAPVIRLGDLFSDAGARSGEAVAQAPAPGAKVVLDAAWLAARAREQKLAWQPHSRFDETTVERASQAIDADAIALELRRELGDRLPTGPVELAMDNPGLRLFVPASSPITLAIDGLTFDARSGRVAAYVSAPAADTNAERVRIGARVFRLVEVPILTRSVAPGEPIAAADVQTIALRAERLNQNYIGNASELIGRTPKRSIRPGEPVRPSDVQVPIVVHKGELVTVVLQTRAIMLTAQATALEDGATGQAIRVSNTRSKKTLDATVTGPGNVALAIPTSLAAR
ncbi:MAG: flagella basal body P-ring formation protein FlgA [Rhodospirillales bacterium]|nr:flagella basal body P-ring formation protein FlgA [Rhodospirillales bacterium]